MGKETGIAWTDSTWNPLRGCSHVSAGCDHCYAERMASRFCGEGQPYYGLITNNRWNGDVMVAESKMDAPLRWGTPRLIFVNSMSDLFHERVNDEDIVRIFKVMLQAWKIGHTFQILTKREKRMNDICNRLRFSTQGEVWLHEPGDAESFGFTLRQLNHIWLGVTVENQAMADRRLPVLESTNAALRMVSIEPMIGPVDLSKYIFSLDWVICGGESGYGARPMKPEWVTSLRDQCRAGRKVPFFFKQWAGGNKNTKPILEGKYYRDFPMMQELKAK